MASLTAAELNDQIVRMRKIVERVRIKLNHRLIRQMKKFRESKIERFQRKAKRLQEELEMCKHIKRDLVSKFALVNCRTLKELNIRGNTPVDQRVLYKLCVDIEILGSVKEFRSKYPRWCEENAFIQRLGLEYQTKDERTVRRKISSIEGQIRGKHGSNCSNNTLGMIIDKLNQAVKHQERKPKRKRKDVSETFVREVAKELLASSVNKSDGHAVIRRIDLSAPDTFSFPAKCTLETGISSLRNKGHGGISNITISARDEEDCEFWVKKQRQPEYCALTEANNATEQPSRKSRIKEVSRRTCNLKLQSGAISPKSESLDLHPSWEAKRRERQQMNISCQVAPKKIVFVDED